MTSSLSRDGRLKARVSVTRAGCQVVVSERGGTLVVRGVSATTGWTKLWSAVYDLPLHRVRDLAHDHVWAGRRDKMEVK